MIQFEDIFTMIKIYFGVKKGQITFNHFMKIGMTLLNKYTWKEMNIE